MAFDVNKHRLVPKHSKLNDSEVKKLCENYHIKVKDLPRILKDDSGIIKLNVKSGDIVKVERVSRTAGVTTYYRVVIDG
jgi:DNA-directed RNA polymerase subunit H